MHVSAHRIVVPLLLAFAGQTMADAQQPVDSQALFRASVDLVTVAAVVRDKHGRVVPSLSRDDFTVTDGNEPRPIVEFHADTNAPISVALLIDGSGSMRHTSDIPRRIAETLLMQLNPERDNVALMTFDTRLLPLRPFTSDFQALRSGLKELETFGATSIYDAIAGGAGIVDEQTRKRRALVVITDGSDNWSSFTPEKVAWIASTIDVPVYVLAVTGNGQTGGEQPGQSQGGELGDVARATGGDYFLTDVETRRSMTLGRIIEDLRHQYLIAFEPASGSGLRALDIRIRKSGLKVRTRQWYSAGAQD